MHNAPTLSRACGLDCPRFARRYSGDRGCFIFLRLLRCFSSPGSLPHAYVFSVGYSLRSGFPHSDISGSKLRCQLPRAFRRLARPSSPDIAKASTTCTYSLDPITLSSLARLKLQATHLCDRFLVRFPSCKKPLESRSMQSQPYLVNLTH